ncbi:MAG: hypothetical protein V2A76_06895 [Planctomycetota bacterium]
MRIPDSIRPNVPTASPLRQRAHEQLLGAGRSGVVFKDLDRLGRVTARKVFDSEGLTKLVQYIFLGAPNPYCWNEHAIETALLRRRILTRLVRYWFGNRVHVARGFSRDWNDELQAYQLHTEFIEGRTPRLDQPFCREGRGQVRDLVEQVMRPLQQRLLESGFDGLVWQAGRGNPVALANFLMVTAPGEDPRWAWIDLESGVPALFPAQPLELLRFYLPKAFQHGGPLFDDVDISRLRDYLDQHEEALVQVVGEADMRALHGDVESLGGHQHAWKQQPRAHRSVDYSLAKGRITDKKAEFYREHPWLWYGRAAWRLPGKVSSWVGREIAIAARWIRGLDYRGIGVGIGRFLTSQKYRRRLAQRLVDRRIGSWLRRGHLKVADAETLRKQLERKESCAYLTDFGVHMAIKPFVKSVEWLLFPSLCAAGLVSETTVAIAVASGGCLARTIYTLGRTIQAGLKRRRKPWVALAVGAVPIVGNLAYPLQLVYSGTDQNDQLAQFMLFDGSTAFGRKLPIWGGPDTLTEHFFNRLPERLMRAPEVPAVPRSSLRKPLRRP